MAVNRRDGTAPRTFSLSLPGDLAEWVNDTRLQEGMESSAAAVRYLLRLQQSATPLDGAQQAKVAQAYEETKRYLMTRVSVALDEIRRDISSSGMEAIDEQNPR